MIEQEKELLLKDLCARLPYVTFVYVEWHETEELEICEDCEDEPNIHTLISCDYYGECQLDDNLYKTIHDIKPYLRPMSSMAEEEAKDYFKNSEYEFSECYEAGANCEPVTIKAACSADEACVNTDWLNAHYFDYRGLIEKGLALPAPEGMYEF